MTDRSDAPQTLYTAWISRGSGYSDEQASTISGLPIRALRELHQLGALTPLTSRPGRGNKRLWDRWAIERAALTGAVMLGGYSLPVAARIATAWANSSSTKDALTHSPSWEDIHHDNPDRWVPLRANGEPVHLAWLSDAFAARQADPECDAFLDIIDGEHLIARTINYDAKMSLRDLKLKDGERRTVRLGRLAEGGAALISADYIYAEKPLTAGQIALFDQVVDGESIRDILERFCVEGLSFLNGGQNFVDPDFMRMSEEPRDVSFLQDATWQDRERRLKEIKATEMARTNSILESARTVLSINMTQALRLALRRAIGLSNGEPNPGLASQPLPGASE